jgi:two-component system sensor histidine kinase/response regulator
MTISLTYDEKVAQRASALCEEHRHRIFAQTDHLFVGLMVFQWLAAIGAALWLSPTTWAGQYSHIHLHVWTAVFVGGAITLYPIMLAWQAPGKASTRYMIAASQMLMSALLIDVTGGRIETHFHIFGSLAFLAFYRDWRVFIPATLVVAADHFFRGLYLPQSVFGVLAANPWRWIEHALWVLFENAFLIRSCLQSVREMKDIAWQRAKLEQTNEVVGRKVAERTADLEAGREELHHAKVAAEAASAAKSTFLATMSHEIRTPMNGILGMTELVLESELTADQRESLGLVQVSAESLLAVINDVLDFSKIEAGKLEFELIPFDLRENLGETMRTLGFRAQQKGLELVYDVDSDVPETLVGDPGRIRQVLVNLVGNAIKFTDLGEILVTAARESEDGGEVLLHFSITDTGVGIASNKQDTIFEAFSQADGSMARKYGGTGLGLTICSRLVEIMGGRIWVESEIGRGSVFHFTAKLAVQSSGTSRTLAQPERLQGMSALIVDNNYTNRRVLHGILTRWGMKPIAVEGGRAAILALEAARNSGHPFPLILLDGQMPEINGFSLARQIQNTPDLVGGTVMMLTSADHIGDASRCRELGISAYSIKPIRPTELLVSICRVLDGSKGFAQRMEPLPKVKIGSRRVLLAEDNKVNQTLALRLLQKLGFDVRVVGDGQAALNALQEEQFELVLMDIQMPAMDGFEATLQIRRAEKSTSAHIPIIAMTAHALKGDEERCLSIGMDGYVSKPIRFNELSDTIERVVRDRATCESKRPNSLADPEAVRSEAFA